LIASQLTTSLQLKDKDDNDSSVGNSKKVDYERKNSNNIKRNMTYKN